MLSTPYQSDVQLTANDVQMLNQLVGRYVFSEEIARQSGVRQLSIGWSPQRAKAPIAFTCRILGYDCAIAMPSVLSIPQVREILQDFSWSMLDYDMQLAVLEVACDSTMISLRELGVEFIASASCLPEQSAWAFELEVEWTSGETALFFLYAETDVLIELAERLQKLGKRPSQDLGWLPVEAAVAIGRSELSFEDLADLHLGDLVLFNPCHSCPPSPDSPMRTSHEVADSEPTEQSCQLVFHELSLTLAGRLSAQVLEPSTIVLRSIGDSEKSQSSSVEDRDSLGLDVVAGSLKCTVNEVLQPRRSYAFKEFDSGEIRLQLGSRILARGQVHSFLDRLVLTITSS